MSTKQPTTGATLRTAADHLAEAIRQQLRQNEKEKARELLLRGLAVKRELTVLTHRVTEKEDDTPAGMDQPV